MCQKQWLWQGTGRQQCANEQNHRFKPANSVRSFWPRLQMCVNLPVWNAFERARARKLPLAFADDRHTSMCAGMISVYIRMCIGWVAHICTQTPASECAYLGNTKSMTTYHSEGLCVKLPPLCPHKSCPSLCKYIWARLQNQSACGRKHICMDTRVHDLSVYVYMHAYMHAYIHMYFCTRT